MILINHTLSFANEIEKEAKNWIQSSFTQNVEKCPHVREVLFCKLTSDAEVTDTYVIQIRFSNENDYNIYKAKFEQEFMQLLFQKFYNKFGIFSSTLEQI